MLGIASSNVRRQVRRLKEMYLIEKFDGRYRVVENAPLSEVFEEKIENYILGAVTSRIKEYMTEIERLRPPKPEPAKRGSEIPALDGDTPPVKRIVLK